MLPTTSLRPVLDAQVPAEGWTCPTQLDRDRLGREVLAMYERVAAAPRPGEFHFHVGAAYAASRLGYDAAELAALPGSCTARFAGVGRPFAAGEVPPGATVLDHACGAGTDLLIAARRAGAKGRAIGVDLTPGMQEVAREAAREAGLGGRVEILAGDFAALPLPDASVDLVLSNGVLNLAPDKLQVLREVRRVLRPGGELWLSDVVLGRPLAAGSRANAALWAACVGGALTESDLPRAVTHAGLTDVCVVARHDPFGGTSLADKFGRHLQVTSITLRARRPH